MGPQLGAEVVVCCRRARRRLRNRIQKSNACTRIRTRDQLIKSQLLYQLSYAGAPAILASLDLGLRRSTTSSNHPLAFVNQLDVRAAVRAPARWNSPGSP